MIEEDINFLKNLNYQIGLRDSFFKKIPTFEKQLEECDKSVRKLTSKFEEIRRRDIYKSVVEELKDLIDKQ